MDYIKNSAQDEPIPKDQPQPPHPPFTTGGGGEGSMNSKLLCLLIRAEFQTSLWKDKTWKGIRNKRDNRTKVYAAN